MRTRMASPYEALLINEKCVSALCVEASPNLSIIFFQLSLYMISRKQKKYNILNNVGEKLDVAVLE